MALDCVEIAVAVGYGDLLFPGLDLPYGPLGDVVRARHRDEPVVHGGDPSRG
jgi:hypothetical protein